MTHIFFLRVWLMVTITTFITQNAFSQQEDTIKLTLQTVIDIAKKSSPASLQASTLKENRYWQWRTYQSNYKPQLIFEGYLPDYSKTNSAVVQPEGDIEFRPVTNDNSRATLRLSQNIGATGTQIFINSYLQRFSDFDRHQTRYNGNPYIIGLQQPLFSFNPLAWDRKIEPLRYQESKKQYAEDLERIGQTACNIFFDLLIAQVDLALAKKNLTNSDAVYKIAALKFNLGRISKSELLQIRVSILNSQKSVAQAELAAETASLQLKSYIGYNHKTPIFLVMPGEVSDVSIDDSTALLHAQNNRHQPIAFQRIKLEAERDVAKARRENGLNANLYATFGFTNRATQAEGIYRSPKDQQTLALGFFIPVLDWGRAASKRKTAQANLKLVNFTIAQEEINFEQAIYTQIKQFNMLRRQMKLNIEADAAAQERYTISHNRYLQGDISITDLTLALQEKDLAKRDFIYTLKNCWSAYYNLRTLTLYDYETQRTLLLD